MKSVTELDVIRWWVHSEWECHSLRTANGIKQVFPKREDIWTADASVILHTFEISRGQWYGWRELPTIRKWFRVHKTLNKSEITGLHGWPKTHIQDISHLPPLEFILIENEDGDRTVLDGNHRLSAYYNNFPGPFTCSYFLCKTGKIPSGKGTYDNMI